MLRGWWLVEVAGCGWIDKFEISTARNNARQSAGVSYERSPLSVVIIDKNFKHPACCINRSRRRNLTNLFSEVRHDLIAWPARSLRPRGHG